MKREALVNESVYHVFSRSIAGYRVLNNEDEYQRLKDVIRYYKKEKPEVRFARYLKLSQEDKLSIDNKHQGREHIVEIISYCFMPTHLHLILRQKKENGISKYVGNILNSYTKYFNTKHGRKGPLWEDRFKSIRVENDEYLLHLTRYIHLNPTTAALVERPEEWLASSYKEFLGSTDISDPICRFDDLIEIKPKEYKVFVEDRIGYQQELHKIKTLLLE
ncbi:MAG TPA: hypothetical protein DEE98_03555 [Elusimicrobia bacterium]|nr:MAG: hypothetical protein A2278_02590 [Elusimicrobia bacterium RIFOXYA12_FULL_49_49]OGS08815.1 MAG: hypothetical protein A2204_08330 [Elusimicrobia bacterium RIFOXYA1_FULL_47_7]OGS16370.1 MAG: hypothetical protein A2251_06040 [Elusimicrobia bacterium RIFOXYA2_FULL_47_53]OGS27252.1 MAG: hypothetical protein A2339_08135 [Elusimicrobia bacterium RIFOXYB12_FULL_50_12]OGS30452.1 MAG: hypothetical protein A2323_02995 [Elusimicrobia bacterium RIFOXYB2_FULL_46_23]HBU69442.1 hypothetical protein [El